MTDAPTWIDAATLRRALPMPAAIDAIEAALLDGLDPAADDPRQRVEAPAGELLLMPSAHAMGVNVKVASVAPDNASRGLPTIHATSILFDPTTLEPVALVDGTALTALRTPAVSAVAVRHLATEDASRLVVFGTGPQARGHVEAVRAVREITGIAVIGRDPDRTATFVRSLPGPGHLRVGEISDVARADVVVCATSATTPLFAADLVQDHTTVVAIGSHLPTTRELPPALMSRATVIVEDETTALREAGDVLLAIEEGALTPNDLTDLATLVRDHPEIDQSRPRVFKGTGMAWQDLVTAAAALRNLGHQTQRG